MKYLSLIILSICTTATSVWIISCEKPEREAKVETGEVTDITTKSAVVKGNIIDVGKGIVEYGHCWSTSQNPTFNLFTKTLFGQKSSPGNFMSEIKDLLPVTTYYIRAYVNDGEVLIYGEQKSFITLDNTFAQLSKSTITEVTPYSCLATAEITDLGLDIDSLIQVGHCWYSSIILPSLADSFTNLGVKSSKGNIQSQIKNLIPGTKYFIRAYAINQKGTAYGDTVSFSTIQFTIPSVKTGTTIEITPNDAKVIGNLNNLGVWIDTVIQHGHCWSENKDPTIVDSKTELGISYNTGEFISNLTSLEELTRYYIRAYAINKVGISYGDNLEITTSSYLPVVQTDYISDITDTSALVYGTIKDFGFNTSELIQFGHCWSIFPNPTIYDQKTELGNTTSLISFISNLNYLITDTTYYVRAYATSREGTSYGENIKFYSMTCENIIYDNRDGKSYKTIRINTQCWMAENLNVGNLIETYSTGKEHTGVYDNGIIEKYCINNDPDNCFKYGGLYEWREMMNYNNESIKDICPNGWHVPSDEEWKILEIELGLNPDQANVRGWRGDNQGEILKNNKELGFYALLGGIRGQQGGTGGNGEYGFYWTSTQTGTSGPIWYRGFTNESIQIERDLLSFAYGLSVRCIKD